MSKKSKRVRRTFSDEFKQDAVDLVVKQGYSCKAAADAVNVSSRSLREWHEKLAPQPEPCRDDASVQELQAEIKRLRKQLQTAELERNILKKSNGVFRERVAVKYVWINEHRDRFPINAMCRVLNVSCSGYYKSLSSTTSKRAERTQRIHDDVQKIYDESHQIYGSYKIADRLQNDDSMETACRNTVAKAMKEMGLKSRVSRSFTPTTTQADSSKKPADNILNQDFDADAPNRKWVTDITYLAVADGWVYLAVVLDLFSRKVVGWSVSESLATPLVSEALRKAMESRRPNTDKLLHHSDRGCQYTSDEYQRVLSTPNITCSMSRTGCCYDNAVMERFFWSLKHEWTNVEDFADIKQVRQSVFEYIEAFYNSKRIHHTLGDKTPNQVEEIHQKKLLA